MGITVEPIKGVKLPTAGTSVHSFGHLQPRELVVSETKPAVVQLTGSGGINFRTRLVTVSGESAAFV
jgi:hypothetical protein